MVPMDLVRGQQAALLPLPWPPEGFLGDTSPKTRGPLSSSSSIGHSVLGLAEKSWVLNFTSTFWVINSSHY